MSELGGAQILVVDDEPAVRALLVRVLSDCGCLVEGVPDGASALDACRQRRYDLAMVDLCLSGLGGRELAAAIAETWPETAVVIATGVSDAGTAVACMRAGAYDYLVKPFDLDDVLVRVGRALERRRLLLENRRHQAELEVRVRRETRAARRMFLGAIESLSSALEAKDDCTRGHSERVSQIAGELARAIGMAREEVRRVRLSARLHDIGKIGVREAVLSKPGPLTEEECRHVQLHSVVGERILAPVLVDSETVRIVRHHHERYGGGGYPDGVSGSAIPAGARVLAVADAFDALTSDRPYRARLSVEGAVEVLRAGAGGQWQPTLVEALVQRLGHPWAVVSRLGGREGCGRVEPAENEGQA